MKKASAYFYIALASTALYEVMVSSPWWTGQKTGRFDMLINLAAPSVFLLLLAYYLETKRYQQYAKWLSIFIIVLQIAVFATIYGTILRIVP